MNGNLKTASEMKNRYFIIACAAAVIATGCAKEAMDNASLSSKTVLSVSIADGAKTTLGELSEGHRPIYWSNGDVLCCNGVSSVALLDVPEEAVSAEFTFDSVLERPYNLVYPATLYKDATTVTLPAIAGNIPLGGQNGNISALTGVIKLTVKGGEHQDKLAYVKVTSASAQLSGNFCIDYAAGTLDAISNNEADKSVKAVIDKALAKDETVELFIPVPVGEYGFTVRIVDVMGHFMEKATATAKTIVAGQVNAFPELVFAPTGTQFDIEINSAEALVKFAQDYNAGAFEENPIVGITDDIVFDDATNAAFLATGGIGISDDGNGNTNYFNGRFYGMGHSIKSWKNYSDDTAVPLFAFTGNDGKVYDLTLDSSCDLKFFNGDAGPLVGRHKGELKNSTNNANVTLSMKNVGTNLGGLIGRVYGGTVDGCTMNGNITYPSTTTGEGISSTLALGGIVGQNQDDDGGSPIKGSTITGCLFTGKIKIGDAANLTGPTISGVYVNVGGITGINEANSKVFSCTVSQGAEIDVCGVFKNRIGGICGNNNGIIEGVEGNLTVNNASLKFTSNGARANTTPTYVGGICGASDGKDITYCTNNGPIETVCNSTTLYAGGIAAYTRNNISHCVNEGNITRTNQADGGATNRYIYMGGIVGIIVLKSDFTISNVTNNADVLCNKIGTSGNTTTFIGGIAGCNQNESGDTNNYNSTIESSTNSGKVSISDNATQVAFPISAVGGIIGVSKVDITISSCTSSGEISCQYAAQKNGRPAYTGGIAGLLDDLNGNGINATISGCNVSGGVQAGNYNNTVTGALTECNFVGGIVGAAVGKEKDAIEIENCSTSSAGDSVAKGVLYCYRGFYGGVAGYVKNVKVTGGSGKSFAKTINANKNAPYGAGLAGVMVSSVFDGCVVAASKMQTAKNMAGFVTNIDATSEVKNCELNGVNLAGGTTNAVFATTSAEGAKFTNNNVKNSKINSVAITDASTFINEGTATISGTTIE